MSDRIKTTPDVPWREPGVGLYITFGCMGCRKNRPTTGARGFGVWRRCKECVAKKRAMNSAHALPHRGSVAP